MIRIFFIAVICFESAYLGQVVLGEIPVANWLCGVFAGNISMVIWLDDYRKGWSMILTDDEIKVDEYGYWIGDDFDAQILAESHLEAKIWASKSSPIQ